MRIKLLILLILLFVISVISFYSGPVKISSGDIFRFLQSKLSGDNATILSQLRLPRILCGALIGGSLGVVGLVFQTLLRNPLAEPYTLGLSGGSSLGAVFALYLGLTPTLFWIPFLSSVGCLIATFLVLLLAHKQLEFESRSLILFGIMISLFFGAIVVTGLSILSPEKLQSALFWLLGQFGTTRDLWILKLGPLLGLGSLALLIKSSSLDALSLGEARALSLGYSPKKERLFIFIISTFLTSLGVSISGLVGFIGLVSPHLARRFLQTSKHKYLLIGSFLVGGALLLLADTVGRTIAGNVEIPAGSVAALFGAPVLLYLLMRQKYASND